VAEALANDLKNKGYRFGGTRSWSGSDDYYEVISAGFE